MKDTRYLIRIYHDTYLDTVKEFDTLVQLKQYLKDNPDLKNYSLWKEILL